MKRIHNILLMSSLLISSCLSIANAASFTFTQDGFSGGGMISGSFETVENLGFEGIIQHSDITSFSIAFSGDSIVEDFAFNNADGDFSFVYILNDDGVLGRTEFFEGSSAETGILIELPDNSYYISGTGPITQLNGGGFVANDDEGYSSAFTGGSAGLVSITPNLILVQSVETPISAIPVPGAIWLFGSGLLGLLKLKKKTTIV